MNRSPAASIQNHGPSPRLSRALVLLLAVATGLVVANLYYLQPLLDAVARDFGVSERVAGGLVTLTQLGYAAGLVLLVPLGDVLERRPLVVGILGVSSLTLVAAGFSPSLAVFAAALVLVGLFSVVAQVLVPLAASLAPDAERGRVVGTVMSGLLFGVLLARTLSGAVASVAGWRAIYFLAAALMVALAVALWRALPKETPRPRLSYPALLASLWTLARREPVLRLRALYGALAFAAFSVFWTSLAFLLARPPHNLSEGVIGLFGLVGATGALVAGWAGRLADRGRANTATLGFALASFLSFGLIAFGAHSLLLLALGAVLLDLGTQGLQIVNQSEIYRLDPGARSRVTTVYLTSYFVGGAVGSALSASAFQAFGWLGVCLVGGFCGLGLVTVWGLHALSTSARSPDRS